MTRTPMITSQIVQIWRLRYLQGKHFNEIAKKIGTEYAATAGSFKIVGDYLNGYRGERKSATYTEAAKQIRQILKDEVINNVKPADQATKSLEELATQTKIKLADQVMTEATAPATPYERLAAAMQELEKAVEAVIEYNATKQKEQITKVMEEAKYTNWSENLKRKFAGMA